jgi:hypothetical protein
VPLTIPLLTTYFQGFVPGSDQGRSMAGTANTEGRPAAPSGVPSGEWEDPYCNEQRFIFDRWRNRSLDDADSASQARGLAAQGLPRSEQIGRIEGVTNGDENEDLPDENADLVDDSLPRGDDQMPGFEEPVEPADESKADGIVPT